MKLVVMLLGLLVLSGCVSRTVERQTVVKEQPTVEVVTVPSGATRPSGETTIIVPRQ